VAVEKFPNTLKEIIEAGSHASKQIFNIMKLASSGKNAEKKNMLAEKRK